MKKKKEISVKDVCLISGENLVHDILYSTKCVECVFHRKRAIFDKKGNITNNIELDERALFLYKGTGYCREHLLKKIQWWKFWK